MNLGDPIRHVFGHSLRGDRVPALLVNLDPAVVLAKQVVPVLVELLERAILRLRLLIHVVVPLRALVSVVVIGVVDN